MDIRKFFSPASSSKSKSNYNKLTLKKNETKAETKVPDSKKGLRKKRGARIMMESDSDDEEPLPKCARSTSVNGKNGYISDSEDELKEKNVLPLPKKRPEAPTRVKKESPKKLKIVSVEDFFGETSVAKSSKKTSAETISAVTKSDIKEANVHEDNEFEKTLEQLNKKEEKPVRSSRSDSTEKLQEKIAVKKKLPVKDEVGKRPASKSPPPKVANTGSRKLVEEHRSPLKKSSQNGTIILPKDNETKNLSSEKEISREVKPLLVEGKKRLSFQLYQNYLHREGPVAPGSKIIPEGEAGCLQGLTFLLTGVLDSLERDEVKDLIEKYGGKVMSTLSKNTTYLVIGRDAGPSKLEKADKLQTKRLTEDELLDLIRTRPGCSVKKAAKAVGKKPLSSTTKPSEVKKACVTTVATPLDKEKPEDRKRTLHKPIDVSETDAKKVKHLAEPHDIKVARVIRLASDELMWVDKYKPTSLKQLIGQQGDKSNAKKLLNWLKNWSYNNKKGKKPLESRWGAFDDSASKKAALLSGSPGLGKTTTAQLVCKELELDYIEMNASDTRSKRNLQEHVQELLNNQTLMGFVSGEGAAVSQKHVIIMDEVDGMSGNEDRGGTQELIALIKTSRIPIICICNDRAHPKIRSLANYCFDLRFQHPRVEQIKAAMMSVAFKEKLKIAPTTLQEIIVASNQDVRQVLHNMCLWATKDKGLTAEQGKEDTRRATKDIKLSPFDVLRKVFSVGQETQGMTVHDKSDLFFHDYSLAPLFVQQNYLDVKPVAAKGDIKKHLGLLSKTADSICDGDIVDRAIRTSQHWSLLPLQAMYSSVIPGDTMRGYLSHRIEFPAWLGKNSTRNHNDKVLQELHMHTRLRTSGNKSELNMDYMSMLRDTLAKPLLEREQEGVPDVLRVLETYYLLKEDMDSVMELSLWSNQKNPLTGVDRKVKAALTRAFNKEGIKTPYSLAQVKKGRARSKNDLEEGEEGPVEGEYSDDDDNNDNIASDAMVKNTSNSTKKKDVTSKPSTSGSSRGKGRRK